MASVNKIILIGNVGSEPELRFTPGGKAVVNFSMATNRSYTPTDGEKVEITTWFRITCWDKLAETINRYVYKGMQVYVEGRVELHTYEKDDGSSGASLEVTAGDVRFLGKPKEQEEEGAPSAELGAEELPF